MSDKKVVKPVALAVGAALAGSFAIGASVASAETVESPFAMTALSSAYLLGDEGACGGDKEGKDETEGSCGEGSCGGDKEGGDGDDHDKDAEKDAEGSCGGDKEAEGSCGGSV